MALTAADIAYWPTTPIIKSMRPTIAERLDNPDFSHSMAIQTSKIFKSTCRSCEPDHTRFDLILHFCLARLEINLHTKFELSRDVKGFQNLKIGRLD